MPYRPPFTITPRLIDLVSRISEEMRRWAAGGAGETQRGIRVTRALSLASVIHAINGETDELQLCAQALCLEEMLHVTIPSGCLFYGETKRRMVVAFDDELRAVTLQAIERLHELIASRATPLAVREKKCDKCSLMEICMPDAMRFKRGVQAWFFHNLKSEISILKSL